MAKPKAVAPAVLKKPVNPLPMVPNPQKKLPPVATGRLAVGESVW